MADSRVLGADLYGLTIVARRNFPTVEEDYRSAHRALTATADMEGVFRRPEHFGGGVNGESMGTWIEVRDRMAHALYETATSLDETATALLLCVDYYAAADATAAAELARLNQVNGVPTPEPR
jgi:hypothetical protein